jgi:hypothetical protein
VLRAPDQVTLLGLVPEVGPTSGERFHDRSVAARGELVEALARNALAVALPQSFRRLQPDGLCFMPRHGFHLVRGDDVVEIVASFECERAEVHTSWGEQGALGVDEAAQTQFDAFFARAGVRRGRRAPPPGYAPEPEG